MGGMHHGPGHDHGPNPFDGFEVQLTALAARVAALEAKAGVTPPVAPTVPTPPETILAALTARVVALEAKAGITPTK